MFSNILEKITNKLVNFLNQDDLLTKRQFGFRKINIAHTILDLTDKVLYQMDSNVTHWV